MPDETDRQKEQGTQAPMPNIKGPPERNKKWAKYMLLDASRDMRVQARVKSHLPDPSI
jgi:hypothetical protein